MIPLEIWSVNTRALNLEDHLNELICMLPDTDRNKALRYRQTADQLRCAVGRHMIRSLAAKTMGTPDIPLSFSEYGKPAFSVPGAPCFNLSHSGDMVVLAMSNNPVGVDVEKIVPVDIKNFEFWLTETEKAAIRDAREPLTEFYRLWTAREAFSKLDGRGIALYDDKRFRSAYRNASCQFRSFELEGHILTLCAGHIPDILEPNMISSEMWAALVAAQKSALQHTVTGQ